MGGDHEAAERPHDLNAEPRDHQAGPTSAAPNRSAAVPAASVRRTPTVAAPTAAPMEVGAADDPAEREADRIAEQVVRRLDGPTDTVAPTVAPAGRIRRSSGHRSGTVGPEGGELDGSTSGRIARARGGGRPLPEAVRDPMERAFGAPLDHVRIHRGPESDRLNRSLNARAFTAGSDVFFADGEYDPSSATGTQTLAHELTHVLQNDGGVRRLWGFGNTGRTRKEEDAIDAEGRRDAKAAASELVSLVSKRRIRAITRFNKAMHLLMRPDVADVVTAVKEATKAPIDDLLDIADFSGFRHEYLMDVILHRGRPSSINRVRMALGAAGEGAIWAISDQEEVLRLFNELSSADQRIMVERHGSELASGLSSKAHQQLLARVEASKAVGATVDDGKLGFGELSTLLRAQDRELGKIVSRAMKGEGTSSVVDKLSVKFTFNLEQLTNDVGAWVKRAKALEASHMGGEPLIRRFVLGEDVDVAIPGTSHRQVVGRGSEFMERLGRRNIMRGWNDGDRQMITLMIGSGATTPSPATTTPAVTPPAVTPPTVKEFGDAAGLDAGRGDADHQRVLRAAVGRATDPKIIAALSALAGEITIQHTRGAKNRRPRVMKTFGALDAAKAIPLYAALAGVEVDPGDSAQVAQLTTRGRVLLSSLLDAAKVKPKNREQVLAQLDQRQSTENLVAFRRYVFKKSFETRKFAQLVATLDADERAIVCADTELVRAIVTHYEKDLTKHGHDDVHRKKVLTRLQQVATALGLVVEAKEGDSLTELIAVKHKRGGKRYEFDARRAAPLVPPRRGADADERAEILRSRELDSWARRWAILITSSNDEKKIYSFALDIVSEVGQVGLHGVFAKLDPAASGKLKKYGLGKALAAGTGVGGGRDYDLVAKIIAKAQTARPKGKADLDTIAGTFERLSGRALLDEWTNIDEYDDLLRRRAGVLTRLTNLEARLRAAVPGSDDESAVRTEMSAALDEFGGTNDQIASQFRLTMREERRQQLNTGTKQLTTPEYFSLLAKFTKHLSKELRTPEMTEALVARGLMPRELEVVGERALFVADQSKQENLRTWHQWSLLTVKGQLREESSGLLTRGMRGLDAASAGGDQSQLEAARTEFAERRSELEQRTKSFEATAKKYAARLKMVISLILDAVIMAATLGIGTLPVLTMTMVQAALSFGKDMALAIIDKVMMPSESNLLAEGSITLVKTALQAALGVGLQQLKGVIDQHLNLVDAKGLAGGNYIMPDGSQHTSGALSSISGFDGLTAEIFFKKFASDLSVAAVSKVGDKTIDVFVGAATSDGTKAFTEFHKSLTLQDLFDVTAAPLFTQLFSRVKDDTTGRLGEALKISGSETQTDAGGTKWKVLEGNEARGMFGATGLDSSHTSANRFDPSFGAEFGHDLLVELGDRTVLKPLENLTTLPTGELDAFIADVRQTNGVEMKGTKQKPEKFDPGTARQATIDRFEKYRKLTGLPPDKWDEALGLIRVATPPKRARGRRMAIGRPRRASV